MVNMNMYKSNLLAIRKKLIEEDYDWVHLILGGEGVGKTTLALITAKIVDPTFTASRIVNDIEELKRIVRNSKPGQVVLIDEGALFFYASDVMTREVKEILKLFTAFRAYNLFFIVCVPQFCDIAKRIRQHRVKSACVVTKRGVFKAYNKNKLNQVYRDNHTGKDVFPKPNFWGTYNKIEGKLWDDYLNKKKEILRSATKSEYISVTDSAKLLDVVYPTIIRWIKQGIIPARKFNKIWKIKRNDILDLKYKNEQINRSTE